MRWELMSDDSFKRFFEQACGLFFPVAGEEERNALTGWVVFMPCHTCGEATEAEKRACNDWVRLVGRKS
jgi:hypothetical protein